MVKKQSTSNDYFLGELLHRAQVVILVLELYQISLPQICLCNYLVFQYIHAVLQQLLGDSL